MSDLTLSQEGIDQYWLMHAVIDAGPLSSISEVVSRAYALARNISDLSPEPMLRSMLWVLGDGGYLVIQSNLVSRGHRKFFIDD